jgi:hypothetical protein
VFTNDQIRDLPMETLLQLVKRPALGLASTPLLADAGAYALQTHGKHLVAQHRKLNNPPPTEKKSKSEKKASAGFFYYASHMSKTLRQKSKTLTQRDAVRMCATMWKDLDEAEQAKNYKLAEEQRAEKLLRKQKKASEDGDDAMDDANDDNDVDDHVDEHVLNTLAA